MQYLIILIYQIIANQLINTTISKLSFYFWKYVRTFILNKWNNLYFVELLLYCHIDISHLSIPFTFVESNLFIAPLT